MIFFYLEDAWLIIKFVNAITIEDLYIAYSEIVYSEKNKIKNIV